MHYSSSVEVSQFHIFSDLGFPRGRTDTRFVYKGKFAVARYSANSQCIRFSEVFPCVDTPQY